jgi:rubrerythrin
MPCPYIGGSLMEDALNIINIVILAILALGAILIAIFIIPVLRELRKTLGKIQGMADEEIKHANWFASLKDSIESTGVYLFVEEMSRELFNDLLGEKSFSHKDVDFSKLKNINELISVFIEFEKDTVIFYEVLVPFIEDAGTLETLDRIISEENNHIKQLQEFQQSEGERTSERIILTPFP